MDRLRSEDLKEEKVVTTPTIIVAGRHGGLTYKIGAIRSDSLSSRGGTSSANLAGFVEGASLFARLS
jgi:hypothetical protein